MIDTAIEVDGVWKKFRRGELHDSLRDLLPAMGRWVVGRRAPSDAHPEREFWALKDVSFTVRRGEALGIIGPNGAGKSTLLKILSRILRPTQGRYVVHGRLRALIEVAAGFHPDLTGRENIYLNGSILGMRRAEIDRRIEEIIEFSGIEAFIDTPVKRYSSGMQARLGFSVAAHTYPDVLLIDEILSVGDAAFRAKCLRHMERLIRSDVAVVFISHNLEQIRLLCQSALVLDQGEVRYLGDVEQACETYYGCFQNRSGSQSVGSPPGKEAGRVVRMCLRDASGEAAFRFGAHQPVVAEIGYRVDRPVQDLGLIIRFSKANGVILTGCSTLHSHVPLPSSVGVHSVQLKIDGLPFAAGDYFCAVELVSRDGVSLDSKLPAYPLSVAAPPDFHWDVYLDHAWHIEPAQNGRLRARA